MAKIILLLEDSAVDRMALELLMKKEGHELTVSSLVAEAIREINEGLVPDVALVDLMLPDGKGERLIHWIIKHKPACKIIVMTGVMDEDRTDILSDLPSVVRVMNKPINVNYLRYLINL